MYKMELTFLFDLEVT